MLCSLTASLPRHSATLLKNKLLIFGGRRASLYLSDMHILDLGKMAALGRAVLRQGLGMRHARWGGGIDIIKTK